MFKITLMTLLLFVSSIKGQENKHALESNLIPFTTPAMMFNTSNPNQKEFKTLIDRMKHYKVPGVSIAVINENQLEWNKTYGIKDASSGEPINEESIFEAASTSKLLTSVIVLHYVEKRLFNLDENVNKYLKSWKVPDNEFTKKEKVTLRRLLTHQSGMPTTNFAYDERIGVPSLIQILKAEPPAQNKPAAPEFIPGTKWQYSNIGYDVIQLVLEDLLHKPFPQIAHEIVFDPLGMNSSTFDYPMKKEWQSREVKPHDDEGVVRQPMMVQNALAHGGLLTTPIDLAKFTREIMLAYIGKSEKILSKDMTKNLLNKELDLDPAMFGIPISEGLGVLLMREGENLVFAHPGSNLPGLNCWLMGWPERGAGIIIMTNGAMGELLSMEIINAFVRTLQQ